MNIQKTFMNIQWGGYRHQPLFPNVWSFMLCTEKCWHAHVLPHDLLWTPQSLVARAEYSPALESHQLWELLLHFTIRVRMTPQGMDWGAIHNASATIADDSVCVDVSTFSYHRWMNYLWFLPYLRTLTRTSSSVLTTLIHDGTTPGTLYPEIIRMKDSPNSISKPTSPNLEPKTSTFCRTPLSSMSSSSTTPSTSGQIMLLPWKWRQWRSYITVAISRRYLPSSNPQRVNWSLLLHSW